MNEARIALCILAMFAVGPTAARDDGPGIAALEMEPGSVKAPPPAMPQAATPGGSAQDAAAIGNPLSAIPLRALAATRERPLFSVTRRPPPPVATPEPAPEPAPATPSEAAPPPFLLVGTVIGPRSQIAVLLDRATNGMVRLRVGDSLSGWRVQKIERRFVIVGGGGGTTKLDLVHEEAPQAIPGAAASRPHSEDN
jgi:general secretion pathway protein N